MGVARASNHRLGEITPDRFGGGVEKAVERDVPAQLSYSLPAVRQDEKQEKAKGEVLA